jgi:hypothetical protein
MGKTAPWLDCLFALPRETGKYPSHFEAYGWADTMKKIATAFAITALVGGVVASETAFANDTGVAQVLHALQRVGGRTCVVDHYHDGSGTGRTRHEAMNAAVSAWSGFTSWEYGTSWGRYGLANRKSANCSRDSSGGWSCSVSAIPCRG